MPSDESRPQKVRSSSRSPYRAPRSHDHHHHHSSRRPRTRSRSPHNERQSRHRRRRSRSPPPRPVILPFQAQPLSKRNYEAHKPLFGSYLDIQKQLYLDDLEEKEARGRWKSFVGRWNRGDLAEGWYDPTTLQKAIQAAASSQPRRPTPPTRPQDSPAGGSEDAGPDQDSDDDEFGPAPPRDLTIRRAGPAVPRLDDLQYRDELNKEYRSRDRSNYVDDIRYERKVDRKAQKDRLEELAPRADPGSRERQLEKKREATSALKGFRDAKEAGDIEVPEADLLGDDGFDAFKKQKKEMERKKTEREIRREEIMRAREAEREERLAGRRQKEEKTMEYLRQIAKDRFG